MPRPMNHPQYEYRPWSPERRKRASDAAKARAAARIKWDARQHMPEQTFAEKFATGPLDWQHELLRAWLNLAILYRKAPTDAEFMNMLADCWEDMARVIAADLRAKANR